jgi:hypothetical protein
LLALSNPDLESAIPKKWFYHVGCPILACRRSRLSFRSHFVLPLSNTAAARCWRSHFHAASCVAFTSCFWVSSANVSTLSIASSATRSFKLGTVVPSRSSHAMLSWSRAISLPCRVSQSLPLSHCLKKRIHFSRFKFTLVGRTRLLTDEVFR